MLTKAMNLYKIAGCFFFKVASPISSENAGNFSFFMTSLQSFISIHFDSKVLCTVFAFQKHPMNSISEMLNKFK